MKTELADRLSPPPESPDWLGFPPASADEIEELENRLGVLLPPSYRAFLETSNGWRRTTFHVGRIRPTQEVNWFCVENENTVTVYSDADSASPDEEYYAYGKDGALGYRDEHLSSLLQIADVDDGVYLLNPQAVTPEGEWEAWFFAHWIPGAERYASFAQLMVHQYESFAKVEKIERSLLRLPRLKTPPPDVPRVPAERSNQRPAKAPTFESLIEQMGSLDEKTRGKAVRTLFGKLRGRNSSERRPDLVATLTDLFNTTADAEVRSACVQALTELADDGTAPAPLFAALSDPSPGVVLSGMFALTYFPDARALDPLCRFIESRANVLYSETAMQRLRKMGDERAVPTLVGVLLDTKNTFDQSFGTAGIALGQCGKRGFEALAAALSHEDPRVRFGTVVGLDVSGDPRSTALLDQMEQDPDPHVFQRAKMRMGEYQRRLFGKEDSGTGN
jgi:hypothetical protein